MNQPLSVLIVDDEYIIRDGLLSFPWESLGFTQVASAVDGVEALELCSLNTFDLVVTDIRMPSIDGIELSKRLSESSPRTRVIILSGHREFDYARGALQAKVAEYLLKPIDPAELETAVRKIKAEIDQGRNMPGNRPGELNPKSITILRLIRPLHNVRPENWMSELTERVGSVILGQAQAADDLILFWGDGANKEFVCDELQKAVTFLGTKVVMHVGFATGLQDAIQAVDRGFYGKEETGISLWTKSGQLPALDFALDQEKNLIKQTIDGDLSSVRLALDELLKAWSPMEKHPQPSEIKNRVSQLIAQTELILNRNNLLVTGIDFLFVKNIINQAPLFSVLWNRAQLFFLQIAEEVNAANENVRSSSRRVVMMATKYIDENYCRSLTLNDLASLGRLSPSYFSIQFKKETGMNYSEYIKRTRIAKACDLLRTSDLKVYEIADAVGYKDLKYFTEVFKNATGTTPLAYRQKIVSA